MTKIKSLVDPTLSLNSYSVPHTRTNIATSQETVDTANTNIYLKKILDEFVLPFRKGSFNEIDPYLKFSKYLQALQYTKKTNICHKLAVESMAAALNAKNIYFNFTIQKHKNSKLSKEIMELQGTINELNRRLRTFDDAFLNSTFCIKISATASVDTFNLLPYLAQKNIYLGWYYYFNTYDISVGIDPDEFLRIKKLVDAMGTTNLPGKNYSEALRVLLVTIKQDSHH